MLEIYQWLQMLVTKEGFELRTTCIQQQLSKPLRFSPRNYRRQKVIAFDIAIEEKIIDSKLFTYLQFAVNLSLFCWIKSFLSYKCLLFKENITLLIILPEV